MRWLCRRPSNTRILTMRKPLLLILTLLTTIIILMIANLFIGSVHIPVRDICGILVGMDSNEIWSNIILQVRLPQTLTAIAAGAGLAVSGLQMQTVFRNPLAGPSVLGISNGSALGVAFVVLLSGRLGGVALSRLGYLGDAAMSIARHFVDNRCDDRLFGQCDYRGAEVSLSRRGCEGFCGVGIRFFFPGFWQSDDSICGDYSDTPTTELFVGEVDESTIVG